MRIARRVPALLALLALAVVATARAHDMFLILDRFFVAPNSTVEIALFNGEFDRSENVITRDRMADVSVVSPAGVTHPSKSAWHDVSRFHPDSLDTAVLSFETGAPGTYVVGVSTNPTVFTLSAEDFNDYLQHDGVVDIIAQRERDGTTGDEATERYSKHVKAILQVGDARSDGYAHALGYPAEFVPLRNPYELGVGDDLEVRFLRDGDPVPNQIVYASHEGFHSHDTEGEHTVAVTVRTDGDGIARIPLSARGRWFIRTIRMVQRPTEPDIDYESSWATLTFEIR